MDRDSVRRLPKDGENLPSVPETLRRCEAGVKGQVAGGEDRRRARKRRRGIRSRLERLGDVMIATVPVGRARRHGLARTGPVGEDGPHGRSENSRRSCLDAQNTVASGL
jgi:hypothetical protein